MTRRCSHCSHNGHNSRTCPNRGVKLFGVRLTDGFIRKSVSMGNLTHYATSGINGGLQNGVAAAAGDALDHQSAAADGYASEDFVTGSSSSRERKKGTPWTEEEHRMFLLGLQNLGKGDWRGIARNFVVSRTPTQVASHAQKYFIRQTNVSRRKRRSSLFDMIPIDTVDAHMQARDFLNENIPQPDSDHHDQMSTPAAMDEEGGGESVGSANSNELDPSPSLPENSPVSYPVVYPAFMAPVFPLSTPIWSAKQETHEVFKPRAVHSTSFIKVDELVGMSKLSLGDSIANAQLPPPPSLSLKLVEGSRRQSAFHPNPPSGNSGMNSTNNAIHAL